MEYTIEYYNEYNFNGETVALPGFIYDNRRLCSKLYIFLKLLGLIF